MNCPALQGKPIGCRTCIFTGGGPSSLCLEKLSEWQKTQKPKEGKEKGRSA